MSNETLAVILSALGLLITLGGGAAAGLAWVVRRIDASETKLAHRIDAVNTTLTDRIDGLQGEVTEVKIAIARLEGRAQPPRMLTR
ncbi:hypothetical protein [Leucobacter triazinivorans]|uniref:Response regulator n=1 Tax=Leucobacter triazinivorans TaxID=1784719 RepID=A0A4P6KH39_9MICO|nr:hypothetical protein [Leucobacter triazinivorans]QBE49847.1 hypothetical protein EVS81_14265 [Leucobacter triazinivorans]